MQIEDDHPSKEQLTAYNLGLLPPDEAVVIDSHILGCDTCCDTVACLSTDDTFVGLLKRARHLPAEQTLDYGAVVPLVSGDVPAPLAEHPRYEVLGLIGRGGMGEVYKARHRKMERIVALKVINQGLVRRSEAIERFQREVKAAAQLSHPNIVTAHDADQAGDYHFMVMEYVDGVDLSQIVKDRGPLPIADACDYIKQAAFGLQHAHERGMVHRDIKPHNLMVTTDGTVKILDFGLASLAPEGVSVGDVSESPGDLTAAGVIMGTPDFISPEQAVDARQADIRSDIYSLGATMYFLLSGRPLFSDVTVLQKFKSEAEAKPESLEQLRVDVPDELVAIVEKMTLKAPKVRYQTPGEVAIALEALGQAAREIEGRKPQLQTVPLRQRIHRTPLTAVATIFVAVIIASIVYYVQTNEGIVRVEVADDTLSVDISGQSVTLRDGSKKPIRIRAGKRKLLIRQIDSGFEFETDHFKVNRNGQLAFRVELIEGNVVVSKDGQPFDQERLSLLDHTPIEKELERPSFDERLQWAIIQASGIPFDQWESIARNPNASTAGVKGEPLSAVLLNLQPDLVSETNSAALNDFRWTGKVTKPRDLNRAIVARRLFRGSLTDPKDDNRKGAQDTHVVSVLQDCITELTYDKATDDKTPIRIDGKVRFESPGLYAGEVDFVAELGKNNDPQVVEFKLPNYGLNITRIADGDWRSKNVGMRTNAYKRPFSYDLKLVPNGAVTVCGYRPYQICEDKRFVKILERLNLSEQERAFLFDANLKQVLNVFWEREGNGRGQPLLILTMLEGTATDFARQRFDVEIGDPTSDTYQWKYYPVGYRSDNQQTTDGQFIRFIDDKTLVLASRETLDAHEIALKTMADNQLRRIASSLSDGAVWMIGSTSNQNFTKELAFSASKSPLINTLMMGIPIWQETSHLAMTLALGEFPALQLSIHAISADRQPQVSQIVRALPATLVSLLRVASYTAGPLDEGTMSATVKALNGATVTEPSATETQITVSLSEAEPYLLRAVDSLMAQRDTQKRHANETSVGNLERIGEAIMLFEREYGWLPSVTTQLPGAKHPVSWRVAILKYLDNSLYEKYNFSEPWDSAENKKVLDAMPEVYRHPNQESGITKTCYVTLVGENTATGNGIDAIRFRADFTDAPAQTILVTEGFTRIPWTKPEDLLIGGVVSLPAIHPDRNGWNVLLGDGSTQFIATTTSAETLQALATRNGGEEVDLAPKQ